MPRPHLENTHMTRQKPISTVALVVALFALVASLSGGAVAAAFIDGGDIKKNAIKSKHIKKQAVKSSDVKNNGLKGKDVKDGTLTEADLAAGTLDDKFKTMRVAATSGANFDAARIAAPEQVLMTEAPFTVYGKCFTDTSGPTTYAYTYIRTSQNGAVFAANEDYNFLDTDTDEEDRELEYDSASTNSASFWRSQFTAIAVDLTGIAGVVSVGAKNGSPAEGNAGYGAGDACLFGLSNTSK